MKGPRSLPGHVRAILVRDGRMTPAGVTRRARVVPCRRCGSWTMAGLDDDRLAGEARTDLRPLTARGELVALMRGRQTYDLAFKAGHYTLDRRNQWDIAGNPPGSRVHTDVVAEHECGYSPVDTMHSLIERPNRKVEISDDCPF